mgnify:CR=1 FL=1
MSEEPFLDVILRYDGKKASSSTPVAIKWEERNWDGPIYIQVKGPQEKNPEGFAGHETQAFGGVLIHGWIEAWRLNTPPGREIPAFYGVRRETKLLQKRSPEIMHRFLCSLQLRVASLIEKWTRVSDSLSCLPSAKRITTRGNGIS